MDINEVTDNDVMSTMKDVNVRQVKGGYVVILVNRNTLRSGAVQGLQEDCVAGTPSEVVALVNDFLGS